MGKEIDCVEYLRGLRSSGLRESHRTMHAAQEALRRGGLDEAERWAVTEQLCVAALDCGATRTATEALEAIEARFPASQYARTRRLEGCAAEARGDAGAAGAAYAELVGDPLEDGGASADVAAMKRQAALLRAAGDYAGAAAQLNRVLAVAMCDTETWLELADVHARANSLRAAAYCLEEVLLAAPWNHRVWTRAAETWHAAGEPVLARKYFAYAVELSRGRDPALHAARVDPRALLGLCAACRTVAAAPQKYAPSQDDIRLNHDTLLWAHNLLTKVLPSASSLSLP